MHKPLPVDLERTLRAALPDGALLTDAGDLIAYSYDNSRRQSMPQGVALVTTHEQVHAIVRACRAAKLPLVSRGRGTNTTGASVPVAGGLVVSFERMDRI